MARRLISLMIAASLGLGLAGPAAAAPAHHRPWWTPIKALGPKAWGFFTCVIWRESRSTWTHPHTIDPSGDQFGIFQIGLGAGIWQRYVQPVIHVSLPAATAFQQAEGAALIYRVDGVGPWRPWDGC